MTTQLGLIADIHASAAPLEEALNVFSREGVTDILCVGDIAGYGTELEESVALLKQWGCVTLSGNHESWYLDREEDKKENSLGTYFSTLPLKWESVIEQVRVYAVHASPPESQMRGIRLLDETGRIVPGLKEQWTDELANFSFDVLIVGHTHQVFAEWLGDKLVVNPGSTKFNHTCAILSLPDNNVRFFSLSGKKPLKSWNWGMMTGE